MLTENEYKLQKAQDSISTSLNFSSKNPRPIIKHTVRNRAHVATRCMCESGFLLGILWIASQHETKKKL